MHLECLTMQDYSESSNPPLMLTDSDRKPHICIITWKQIYEHHNTLLAHTGTKSVLEITQIKRFSGVYNACFSVQYNKIKYNGSLLLHLIPTHIKALYSYLLYSNHNLNNVPKHHQIHWCFSSINKHPEFLQHFEEWIFFSGVHHTSLSLLLFRRWKYLPT